MWRLSMAVALGGLMLAGCQTVRPGTPERLAACDVMIAHYGKTRPGVMTVQEWGEHAWDTGGVAMDRNGDGRIDPLEWTGGRPRPADPLEQSAYDHQLRSFEKLDRNRKGYLDRADISRDAGPGFRLMDRNHDGWLTRDECAAILPRPIELV